MREIYFGVPNPAPPKFAVEGVPNVLTLPKDTRRFSFGEGTASRLTGSLANGDDLSGEYDYISDAKVGSTRR